MPFKSQAQRRFLYATNPNVAKKFAKHTPKGKKLPERVKEAAMASAKIKAAKDVLVKRLSRLLYGAKPDRAERFAEMGALVGGGSGSLAGGKAGEMAGARLAQRLFPRASEKEMLRQNYPGDQHSPKIDQADDKNKDMG